MLVLVAELEHGKFIKRIIVVRHPEEALLAAVHTPAVLHKPRTISGRRIPEFISGHIIVPADDSNRVVLETLSALGIRGVEVAVVVLGRVIVKVAVNGFSAEYELFQLIIDCLPV